jgi:hypothetical protein
MYMRPRAEAGTGNKQGQFVKYFHKIHVCKLRETCRKN